jgi:hypothetical protein
MDDDDGPRTGGELDESADEHREIEDKDRIVELAGDGAEHLELERPEIGEVLVDFIEARATFARGDEVTLEGGKARGGEGVADRFTLVDSLLEDLDFPAREAVFQTIEAGAQGNSRTGEDGELLVKTNAMPESHGPGLLMSRVNEGRTFFEPREVNSLLAVTGD